MSSSQEIAEMSVQKKKETKKGDKQIFKKLKDEINTRPGREKRRRVE